MEIYTKEPLSYQEQLDLLISRKLSVVNKEKALHLLENLSYYRLSGYFYPQLKEPKNKHIFKENSSFESAFNMYKFDRELRIFLSSNIEKIEISFRAKLTYILSHRYDAFWYTYDKLFKNQVKHSASIASLKKSINDSTEDFVIQYRKNYINNYLPSWMALEIVTFTHLSVVYENLKDTRAKSEIADYFGVKYQILENWLKLLTYSRNICAHHSRFWNRALSLKASKITTDLDYPFINTKGVPKNKAFMYISIVKYLIDRVNPKNNFKKNLLELFEKYPNIDYEKSMAFPESWREEPLWDS